MCAAGGDGCRCRDRVHHSPESPGWNPSTLEALIGRTSLMMQLMFVGVPHHGLSVAGGVTSGGRWRYME